MRCHLVKISIIIVSYNSEEDIENCLFSLIKEVKNIPNEIFVVDNNSRDKTVQILQEKFPDVNLIVNDFNAGFPGANNQAIARAQGELIFLLNPDTIVCPSSVHTLMAAMDIDQCIGACGPRLVDGFGRVAPDIRRPTVLGVIGSVLWGTRFQRQHLPTDQVEILSGAALLTRRSVLDVVGLLDERMFWREDVDFCFRALKAGYLNRVVPESTIVHLVGRSASSNIELALEKPISSSIFYFMKHHGRSAAFLVMLFLWWQTVLRFVKWAVIGIVRPSTEAQRRFDALKKIMLRFPGYLRTARNTL